MTYSKHESWSKIGSVAAALSLVLLGCVSGLAETLSVTHNDGLSTTLEGCSGDRDGSHLLTPLAIDDTFTIRDPSDPVVYEYLLQAQASADDSNWPFCDIATATVSGFVEFSFDLPLIPAVWDIGVDYEYHGVVALDGDEVAEVTRTRPHGFGVLSSLGTTQILGARRTTTGVTHFDGTQQEQITGISGFDGPGSVRFSTTLTADSDFFGGEAYASLGHASGLSSFGLDNTYHDGEDGLKVRLTFAPHLNLSGHIFTSDLALSAGETLSGYGTFDGDVSGVADSAITCLSGDLMVGNAASATGFNMAGDVTVVGGKLLLNDADAAVLGGRAHISGTGTLRVAGELQIDGTITLAGGMLDVGRLTGVGSLEWTQGKLKSDRVVVVGPDFVFGEPLTISSGQELIADVVVETGGSLTVSGGTIFAADTAVETGGSLTVSGGTIFGNVDAWNGSEVNISGGTVADGSGPSGRPNRLYAQRDSTVNVVGTNFVLDGTDITNTLTLNVPFVIDGRDVGFSGLLEDGSPFSYDLEFFSPSATLTVTLVAPGDYNANGLVDQADLDLVLLNWGSPVSPVPEGWLNDFPTADFVDQDDLDRVLLNWGNTSTATGVVPEPGNVMLLLVGVVFACLARRRMVR